MSHISLCECLINEIESAARTFQQNILANFHLQNCSNHPLHQLTGRHWRATLLLPLNTQLKEFPSRFGDSDELHPNFPMCFSEWYWSGSSACVNGGKWIKYCYWKVISLWDVYRSSSLAENFNVMETSAKKIRTEFGSSVVWSGLSMVWTPINRLPERFGKFGPIIAQYFYWHYYYYYYYYYYYCVLLLKVLTL